jgi:hypothetical protein
MPDEQSSAGSLREAVRIGVLYVLGLHWGSEVTPGDVMTFLAFLVAGISVFFLAQQIKASAKQANEAAAAQRGRFLLDVVNRYFDDPGMRRLYVKLDTKQFRFSDPVDYMGSPDAEAISRMLYTFDTIAHLVDLGVLSLEDVAIMGFRITRMLDDPEIRKVLEWLDSDYLRQRGPSHSHGPARKLAQQLADRKLEYRAERGERL